METEDIHRATSADGTEIVGRVQGEGPALVLVPGGPGDGESSFAALVEELSVTFTCHAMSSRGKGLSAPSGDHSQSRLVEDVAAYVDSIDGPVALFGHSSGAILALEAVVDDTDVSALALYEPSNFATLPDERLADLEAVVADAARVHERDPVEATRIFFEGIAVANEEELAGLESAGVFDTTATNLHTVISLVDQSGLPKLTDPRLPERVEVPVLLLTGSRTSPIYAEAARDLVERLPEVQVVELPGAGHLGPQFFPEAVAAELSRFLTNATAAA